MGYQKPDHFVTLPSHNFKVYIGMIPMAFSKVSSIEIEIETEPLVEGGQNKFVHSMFSPSKSEKTLVLERGVAEEPIEAMLRCLEVGRRFDNIIIFVNRNNNATKGGRIYCASEILLKKRSLSELDAMGSQVFIEKLEFTYHTMTEVPE